MAQVTAGQRVGMFILGLVMALAGVFIIFGIYPFTGMMFQFPRNAGTMAYVWWFIFKFVASILFIIGGALSMRGAVVTN